MQYTEKEEKFYKTPFENHILDDLGNGDYLWHQPKTSVYQSWILIKPFRLIIYGDLGDWSFYTPKNPLPLIRGVIEGNNTHYLFEKCTKETPYNEDETRQYLREYFDELIENSIEEENEEETDQLREWRKELETEDFSCFYSVVTWLESLQMENSKRTYFDAAYEMPTFSFSKSSKLWVLFLLKTFLEAYDKLKHPILSTEEQKTMLPT